MREVARLPDQHAEGVSLIALDLGGKLARESSGRESRRPTARWGRDVMTKRVFVSWRPCRGDRRTCPGRRIDCRAERVSTPLAPEARRASSRNHREACWMALSLSWLRSLSSRYARCVVRASRWGLATRTASSTTSRRSTGSPSIATMLTSCARWRPTDASTRWETHECAPCARLADRGRPLRREERLLVLGVGRAASIDGGRSPSRAPASRAGYDAGAPSTGTATSPQLQKVPVRRCSLPTRPTSSTTAQIWLITAFTCSLARHLFGRTAAASRSGVIWSTGTTAPGPGHSRAGCPRARRNLDLTAGVG